MFVNNFVKNTMGNLKQAPILVTSLIAVTKHLRKEETILSHGLRAQSIAGRKPRWQESEAAARISSAVRKQREMNGGAQLTSCFVLCDLSP